MIRALWYMVKVGLLVAAAVWLVDRPGSVDISWMDYTFKIQLGFFLLILVAVILVAIFIYRILILLAGLPDRYRRYRRLSNREKGHRALALGLTAVAAGDGRGASIQAQRAVRFLPGDRGMPLLLQAQAERLKGNEEAARKIFTDMLENKDTAFLGVRGLLQGALESGNYLKALELSRQGEKLYPKQKWILRIVYDLEIRNRNWDDARKILGRLQKIDGFEEGQAKRERAVIHLAEAEMLEQNGLREAALKKIKAAYKDDPYFVPAALRLARFYNADGHKRAAVKVIEKVWTVSPHPDLAVLWPELAAEKNTRDPLARLKWFEKLMVRAKDHPESHIMMAKASMDASLWGEARDHLQKADIPGVDARIYQLRADIERRSARNEIEARHWLEKASGAPEPKCWVCTETGRVYPEWMPIAEPHGSFNTIEWNTPQSTVTHVLPVRFAGGDVLLEAPTIRS